MKIHINKSDAFAVPDSISEHFDFFTRSLPHRADVCLSKQGEYSVLVDYSADSEWELAAKRSPQYKTTVMNVSYKMADAFNKCNDAFATLYLQTDKPKTTTGIKNKLNRLMPEKYTWEKFSLNPPDKAELQKDLQRDAEAEFFSFWKSNKKAKLRFINDNLDSEYNKRLQFFNQAASYHQAIQSYLASKADEQYLKEYQAKKKALEDELYGQEDLVNKRLEELKDKCLLPYAADLDCMYDKDCGVLQCTVSIPENLGIPAAKASLLSSGKISIKPKTKKETEADCTNTLIGLSYYLAGHLFNIAFNINTVSITLVSGHSAYYWVEFNRKQFASLSFKEASPADNLLLYPHVIEIKKSNIELMPVEELKKRVAKVKETQPSGN
ncbi:MAG: hypothetical protein J6M30_09700 [Bacteroidales bacterium]|nr:hypothetical protein [Bacteroidales bacterium]MBP3254763.1 hypothetical protein [Bacteroidales bacterium]